MQSIETQQRIRSLRLKIDAENSGKTGNEDGLEDHTMIDVCTTFFSLVYLRDKHLTLPLLTAT